MKALKTIKEATPEALKKYKTMATTWNMLQGITYNDYNEAKEIIQKLVSDIKSNLNEYEKLAISKLIAEGDPQVKTEVFIRVQKNNEYPTLYGATPFVYVSNPMLVCGQGSNMENFRKEVGIDDAGSKETFIDFIVCKDSATANAISSNIYTDKIENGVKEFMKNYANKLNIPPSDSKELKNRRKLLDFIDQSKFNVIEENDKGEYVFNEIEMKNFSKKYITSLNFRKPCGDTVKFLEKSGYINASEIGSYTAAYELISWGANANNYYSADIFTITPEGKVGSVEYGIEKTSLNNTYNIEEINKANGNVKIFRAKIDNSTGTVECFEVKGGIK